MLFTERQTAHVLAALRHCQTLDLSGMPHFEETPPLTDSEVDTLCEEFNQPEEVETADSATEGNAHPYTVVGLYPDSDWDGSMHDASFVDFVTASSPSAAAAAARLQTARNRAESWDHLDAETLERETADYASKVAILAVFPRHTKDLYDPNEETVLESNDSDQSGDASPAVPTTERN